MFRAQAPTVFGFLLLRCGSRAIAEDLTGETFLAASRRFADGRGDEVTAGWLLTVARRRLIDHWRSAGSHRRRVERMAREPACDDPPTAEDDGRVEAALGSLPDRQRAVLVLRYLDEFSVSEIASALDLTYKATESLLSRARAGFSAAFLEDDGE